MSRNARILILALAICATLGFALVSASHIDSSPNGCNLCFVAHTVAFETASGPVWLGPQIAGFFILILLVSGYRPCALRQLSSRGPPSLAR